MCKSMLNNLNFNEILLYKGLMKNLINYILILTLFKHW